MNHIDDRRFPVLAWGVLFYSLTVIAWGYYLRVSESGDACGTDWPLCDGAFVPAAAEFPTWVEYTHRISSGLALLLVVLMTAWAVRSFDRGHAVRSAAGAALLFTITESLFGALLVVLGWVAGDVSIGRIVIRPFHVTNTFFLMASLALTAWWASRGVAERPRFGRLRRIGVLPGLVGMVAIAATGSWTGLAGTAFPVASLGEGLRQYLDPAHLLIYLRTVHPIVAVIVTILILRQAFASRRGDASAVERRLGTAVLSIALVQLLIGPLTIVLLHPTGLRLLHLLLADLLWLGLVLLSAASMEVGRFTPERSYSPQGGSSRSRPGAAMP